MQMRQEGAELPAQGQGFMLRGRSGLSEAQLQLLGTVTNGVFDYPAVEAATLRLFTRMHLADWAPPPANTQNSGFGSGAGGRGAGAGRWGGRAGRGLEAGGSGLRGGRRGPRGQLRDGRVGGGRRRRRRV